MRQSLLTSPDLAELAREVRADRTQEEVAQRLHVTKQAISQAENLNIGSNLNTLRIRIIQELTGQQISGPFWIMEDSLHPQ